MKTIHLAGGCFWGVEHYLKGIEGVVGTEVGFANGHLPSPTYEQVYTDTTGHAEAVKVVYDPSHLSLEALLEDYFCAIDPLAANRQGNDFGTRYRTGIYYSSGEDLPVIQAVRARVESRVGAPLAVEVEPLGSFFTAEDRHQDYLVKNPDGYCHLPLKLFRYPKLLSDLRALLGDEPDETARLANAAALLKERMGFLWVGFYLVKGSLPGGSALHGNPAAGRELVLGPFQGPSACMRIGYGRGVCGTAWKGERTIVVPDVGAFPGHIACFSLSRSEIVVPLPARSATLSADGKLPDGGAASPGTSRVRGVLDADSTELSAFDHIDAHWLGRLAAIL